MWHFQRKQKQNYKQVKKIKTKPAVHFHQHHVHGKHQPDLSLQFEDMGMCSHSEEALHVGGQHCRTGVRTFKLVVGQGALE